MKNLKGKKETRNALMKAKKIFFSFSYCIEVYGVSVVWIYKKGLWRNEIPYLQIHFRDKIKKDFCFFFKN